MEEGQFNLWETLGGAKDESKVTVVTTSGTTREFCTVFRNPETKKFLGLVSNQQLTEVVEEKDKIHFYRPNNTIDGLKTRITLTDKNFIVYVNAIPWEFDGEWKLVETFTILKLVKLE